MPVLFDPDQGKVLFDPDQGKVLFESPCPEISLSCDQITASRTKCGWSEFTGGGDGKLWLTKTVVQSYTFDVGDGPYICGDCHFTGSMDTTDIYTIDPDTCGVTCDRSGSGSYNVTCHGITVSTCTYTRHAGSDPGNCDPPFYQGSGHVVITDYNCAGVFQETQEFDQFDTAISDEPLPFACGGAYAVIEIDETLTPTVKTETYVMGGTGGGSGSGTITLSDENTEDACATAVTLLPAYDNDFNDPCNASRDSSESSCTIARFKPKFSIPEALARDLIICYNEHFVPDEGDPVDTSKTVTIPAGETEVIGDEVVEPDDDGEITITMIDCC